jgi:hypothetical protein
VLVVDETVLEVSVAVVVDTVAVVLLKEVVVKVTEVMVVAVMVVLLIDDVVEVSVNVVLVNVVDEAVVVEVSLNVVSVAVVLVAVVEDTVVLLTVIVVAVAEVVEMEVDVVDVVDWHSNPATSLSLYNGLYPLVRDKATSTFIKAPEYSSAPEYSGFDSVPAKNFHRGVTIMSGLDIWIIERPTISTSIYGIPIVTPYTPVDASRNDASSNPPCIAADPLSADTR